MGWDKPHVQTMIGMMGYTQDTRNDHIWKQTINGKDYCVDFKKEEIFVFIGTDRITDLNDEPFQALKTAVEYASVESPERREVEAKPSTTEEKPETPANVPSEPKQDKPVETPKPTRVPAQRAPVPVRPNGQAVSIPGYTRDQIETIKNTVAKGATDSELQMFIHVAEKYGLDPFLKEIYYSAELHTILASRDGYLKAAMRDPMYDGLQSMAVCENDDFSLDVVAGKVHHIFGKGDRGNVIGAWAIAYHKERRPVIAYAPLKEYAKNNSIWNKYESAMICKVSESFVLKRQFGFSGLVTQEELGMEVV